MSHPAIAGLPIVLGGNVFGWTIDQDMSFAVLDAFYAAGGRMIDTAEIYSAWAPGNKGGESETIIGAWLASRGHRDELRIHTKTNAMGTAGLSAPAKVAAALEGSLQRLQTDYVDLYYAHRDEPETPLAEVVAGFGELIASGKVREAGASNFSAERLGEAVAAAKAGGVQGFTVLQNEYNLVSRGAYEGAVQDLCVAEGIACLPYYGLASGFLTGKYRSEADLAKSPRGGGMAKLLESGAPVLAAMDEVATEAGASLAAIALAWLIAQPGIRAPIASATSPAQVAQLVEAATLKLSDAQLATLSAAG